MGGGEPAIRRGAARPRGGRGTRQREIVGVQSSVRKPDERAPRRKDRQRGAETTASRVWILHRCNCVLRRDWGRVERLAPGVQEAMPTATLTFTLPEEEPEFIAASRSMSLASSLRAIDERCRIAIKHEDSASQVLEEIRGMIPWEIIELR